MPEIEVKILGIDAEAVARTLEASGAVVVFDGLVKCLHFDHEDASLRRAGCLFRLRRWEPRVGSGFYGKFEICYKGPKQVVDGCKVRKEIETTVADADVFESMMTALGYVVTLDNEKRRRSYEWALADDGGARVHVDIDEYPHVPAYMEIEGPDRAAINRAIEALGLSACEVSTETANELFARKWPDVDFEWLKF